MLVDVDVEQLRATVYQTFARTGRRPELSDLAQTLGASSKEVTAGMRQLAAARHLVLDSEGEILMAHPFSAIPLGFSVMGTNVLWWGGCAWDSFALPHLVPEADPALVATRCPGCGRALAWNVRRSEPPTGEEVAHFLVPAGRMWEDVVYTCSNQRIYCSTACLDRSLESSDRTRGHVMDLTTLWRLAANWYRGRLSSPYVRRDPATAADYLRDVGLVGAFWGA